jgi:hypothetical protein
LNYLHKFCENQVADSNLTLKHSPRNQDRAYFLLYIYHSNPYECKHFLYFAQGLQHEFFAVARLNYLADYNKLLILNNPTEKSKRVKSGERGGSSTSYPPFTKCGVKILTDVDSKVRRRLILLKSNILMGYICFVIIWKHCYPSKQ